jgi:mono/diheme cytochrome c family protein
MLRTSILLLSVLGADDLGLQTWMARCKGCHGVDGKAQTRIGASEKIPDFTSAKWQASFADPDIKQVVLDGSPSNAKMKPFGDKLTAEEVDAVVRYIRSLKAR